MIETHLAGHATAPDADTRIMKGVRKKKANETTTHKQRVMLFVILTAVVVVVVMLFIASTRKPVSPAPARLGYKNVSTDQIEKTS